jgi:hypothetical protein
MVEVAASVTPHRLQFTPYSAPEHVNDDIAEAVLECVRRLAQNTKKRPKLIIILSRQTICRIRCCRLSIP